jgi:hypothetical protein
MMTPPKDMRAWTFGESGPYANADRDQEEPHETTGHPPTQDCCDDANNTTDDASDKALAR